MMALIIAAVFLLIVVVVCIAMATEPDELWPD